MADMQMQMAASGCSWAHELAPSRRPWSSRAMPDQQPVAGSNPAAFLFWFAFITLCSFFGARALGPGGSALC